MALNFDWFNQPQGGLGADTNRLYFEQNPQSLWAGLAHNATQGNPASAFGRFMASQMGLQHNLYEAQAPQHPNVMWADFASGLVPHLRQAFALQSASQRGESPAPFDPAGRIVW